ncbi:MAG: ABC transporter ATP-binding protein [Halobacteriovoraceae bacterium]|nr:ABC transporter ATP-binding protein [Halobacteriovoraceae bacterium]
MVLKVNNLHKSYKKTQVLRGISLDIGESKNLAIVGSSGSGKSTLLYILGGLEKSDEGEVLVDNINIANLNDEQLADFRNQSIGFVFQFHFLLPSMNCLDNILLPAKIGGHSLKKVKTRILEFARVLKVEHCLKKYPFEISGGEQQRVNIIWAISLSPKLLLCDEPTGNLDSENTQIVLELLRKVAHEIGSILVVVTHDVAIADSFEQKITIEDGQIIS